MIIPDPDFPSNPPAFPNEVGYKHQRGGMTLRDYFAAKAMHQIIKEAHALEEACDEENDFSFKATIIPFAKEAYQWADAMLKAREA